MDATKTVPKSRIILMWILMVGFIVFITVFFFWLAHNTSAPPPEEPGAPADNPIVHAIFFGAVGVFFLVLGVSGYFIVLLTNCFTFNFSQPVWNALKAKRYIANIVVPVGISLGLGFILVAILTPVLGSMGLPPRQIGIWPVLVVLVVIQLIQLWVLIWSPVERGMILKRLAALGITPEHLKGAVLAGISNPGSGTVKRFGAIEEDMGALWVTADRLAWRGDVEQFDLTRDQVVQIERKADNRSTSVLAGIAHPILHVRLPDGSIRQMRLHSEGFWTMGGRRKAMDALAEALEGWHAGTPVG